jgi:hypothetical protein
MRRVRMIWLGRLLPAVVLVSLACGGGDGPSSPNPPPGSLTVSGTVVDSCLQPVANALVWIRNRGVTRTGASGAFSFTDVSSPYDIGTVEDYRDWKRVRIYAALTTTQVRLTLAHAQAPLHQGALEGQFTVGSGASAQVPVPLGRRTGFTFTPPGAVGSLGFLGDVNPYHLEAAWCGEPATAGSFQALQWSTQTSPNNPNIAAEFYGWGHATLNAQEGMTSAGQDVSLDSVGTAALSGTIIAPPGYTLLNRTVGLDPGAVVQPLISLNFAQPSQGLPADFTVAVPDAPGVQLSISAEAGTDGGDAKSWLRRVSPAGPATLGMDLAPTMLGPSAGAAVDLTTQDFTWQSATTGVQSLFVNLWFPDGGGGLSNAVDYQIFTLGRSFRVPLPAELGLSAIPAGSRGEWHVGTSNEPTLARLTGTGSPVLLTGDILGVALPVPDSAEVRFATATADGRFTLP